MGLPYTYPTEEGGIRFEWTLADGTEASLDIDLRSREGYWHELKADGMEDLEQPLDLAADDGWKFIADRLLSDQ